MDSKEIIGLLEKRLKESRLKHTLGVRDTAVELAEIYGCDAEKAEKAALLHDFCKNLSVEESDFLVNKYEIGQEYLGNTALAHSKVAAKVLEHEYGFKDREILGAIECHTVGKPGMTVLEKIIYVSDTIEPGRSFPGVEELRELAYKDIHEACIKVLDRSIMFVLSKGEKMDNKAIAWKAAEVADSKKGQDITLIDISKTSGFADYFVITHAPSDRLMKTIADEVEDKLAELGVFLKHSEGKNGTGWILMDFGDIIVNVFSKEQRERYNLEKLWGDGEITYFEGTKDI
ncbi:MAG: bis(5'-nucleosyl)-tetraphosphatase (symmetrical) YqeK [Firmicutes bacterium]|nr:bis(5'-nucleosyl)-tetraphosphatase (symmetrical) YqeK [Bacillota bacterium]MBR6701191.1 bis(5'-nucleosyl)-tetraphosphatase (symmetrical) YqeK [Bacillota bacterium]